MFKFLRRNEDGLQTIGLCWHEQAWARKAVELRLWYPDPKRDSEKPFRFVIELVWGPGIGYQNGGGFFFGLNCKDQRRNGNIHKRTPVQAGVVYHGSRGFDLSTGRRPYVY